MVTITQGATPAVADYAQDHTYELYKEHAHLLDLSKSWTSQDYNTVHDDVQEQSFEICQKTLHPDDTLTHDNTTGEGQDLREKVKHLCLWRLGRNGRGASLCTIGPYMRTIIPKFSEIFRR
jgi:hypothetical protein